MWGFLKAMLYTVRSGWFLDLWHVLPFTLLPTIVICIAVVLRDLGQKKASLLTYTEHTLKKNRTLKKSYGTRASRTMPSWKSPITTGCPEQASSLLWITRVCPPLSEPLLHQEQNCCCCEQTKVVLGFWPEATHFRSVWPRAETVAVTFTHLQTENTPYFPTSLYHGKITLEALKWIKSNFLAFPIDWYWYSRHGKFPTVLFWDLEINLSPPSLHLSPT